MELRDLRYWMFKIEKILSTVPGVIETSEESDSSDVTTDGEDLAVNVSDWLTLNFETNKTFIWPQITVE